MTQLVMPRRWFGNTCEDRVLLVLKDKQWHGTEELCRSEAGGFRLGARIQTLRKLGWNIEVRRKPDSMQCEYRLLSDFVVYE